MAERGENPHGEVDFAQRYEPASVLDAGCGTGRVAIEFARRGVDAAGTDLDESMLATAQSKAPELTWVQSDLSALDMGRTFDAVVMAGNIILFVQPGTESAVVAGAARHVAPGGHLIAGFSLGRGVTADEWDAWCTDAGLRPIERYSTWDGDPWDDDGNYLVAVATR
jgi:ubiquinone/menaquinone biosynthesis C-methylase UbiE